MKEKRNENPSSQKRYQYRVKRLGLSIVSLAPLRRAERIPKMPGTPHPMIMATATAEMVMSAN